MTGDLLYRGKVPRDPQALTPSGRVTFASKPGAVHLRLSAESASGQLIDSEERESLVPDFTKVGPTVTTPQIFRARTARELQQIRQSASAVPTTAREFARTEQLLIRFRAYGPGGTPPALTMRLLNSLGETMSTFPAPERKADGAYDVPFSLGGLVTGSYLIEIESATSDLKSRGLGIQGEAGRETAACQEIAELALDKARQALPVAHRRRLGAERLKVVAHELARVDYVR